MRGLLQSPLLVRGLRLRVEEDSSFEDGLGRRLRG